MSPLCEVAALWLLFVCLFVCLFGAMPLLFVVVCFTLRIEPRVCVCVLADGVGSRALVWRGNVLLYIVYVLLAGNG